MGKKQLQKQIRALEQRIAQTVASPTIAPAEPARTPRADGWGNVLSGIGVAQRDKRLGSTYNADYLDRDTMEQLWRGDDLAARIVETVPEQALREGFEIRIQACEDDAMGELEGEDDLEGEEDPAEALVTDPKARMGQPDSEQSAPLTNDPQSSAAPAQEPATGAADQPSEKPASEPKPKDEKKDAFPFQGGAPAMPEKPKAPPKPIKPKDESVKEQSEAIGECFKDLRFEHKLRSALFQHRAYGGSCLFLGADDGLDPRLPLDETKIKSFKWITVLNAFEVQPDRYYVDPRAPKFGEPETYKITSVNMPIGAGQTNNQVDVAIHESRLIRFEGIVVSRRQILEGPAPGWGDSVLVRCNQILSDFNLSWGAAGIILQDYGQAVIKLEGLAELLATDQDEAIINRAKMIDLMRSTARAIMIDANEEFERKGTPLTGYGDLLDKLCNRLSAAAKIPVTFLMGQAPAGLGATGDSDIRIFYDQIREYQRTTVKPAIERVTKLLCLAKDGPTKGKEPENWSVFFPSLWQPTEKELAETRYIQAQTDQIYIQANVVTPEEIAESRFGGDEWSPDTNIDFDAREQGVKDFEIASKEFDKESKKAMKNAPKVDPNAQPFGAKPAPAMPPK